LSVPKVRIIKEKCDPVAAEDKSSSTTNRHHDFTNGTKTSSGYDFETFYVNASTNRTNSDCRTYSAIHGDLA